MRRRWVIGVGGCVLAACVLGAGCGTLLDIQPDTPPPGADAGVAVPEGGGADGGTDGAGGDGAADAADAAPSTPACGVAAAADPCVLAGGADGANLGSIAVGGGNVYFAHHVTGGTISRVPTTGGSPTQFASPSNSPAGLFATDTALFWVTEGDKQIVRQLFTATAPAEASVDGTGLTPARIVAIGTETFWTEPGTGGSNGQVRAGLVPLTVGGPIAQNEVMPTVLAADANFVYFADKNSSGKVARVTHSGSATTPAGMTFSQVTGLALAPTLQIAAITAMSGVHRISTASASSFMGVWTPVSGTTTAVDLVADDATGTLYVLDSDGTLEIIANLPPPAVTKKLIAGCAVGRGIAQDATHVYLACKDTIVRVPK